MKNYYKILEVEENASDEDIKKSYRSLSKKYHPDINPDGAEKFKEINEAYETIGDKKKREEYNHKKNNPYAGTQFDDLFSQMFGGSPHNFRQRPKNAPDKIVRVQVSPIESYKGSEKTINYFRDNHCNTCNGTGGEQQICGTCEGSGFQIKTFGTGFMVQQIRMACQTCAGKGYNLIKRCYSCQGKGTIPGAKEVRVNLPKGVDNGQFLKLQGLGDFKNGEYGDLVIQIELNPVDNFEKVNNDLVYSLYLNLEEIQNDRFNIPHPDGDLQIPIPKTFDTSKPLRIKGKGYSGGDMYIKLHVRFERTT